MKKIIILLCFIIVGCAAAAPMHKPGATQSDAIRDNAECELAGAQYASGMGFNGNLLIIADYQARCLRGRGWN